MRFPRFRFTIRRMMIFTAMVALGLVAEREFSDGSPPRFVVQGVPARINRLRPGMTREQVEVILGLERSWIWGGTSAAFQRRVRDGYYMMEEYPPRSPWLIRLGFTIEEGASGPMNKNDRLIGASFLHNRRVVAKMPGQP